MASPRKTKTKQKKSGNGNFKKRLDALQKDPRVPKVLGITIIFLTVILSVAFFSYLFHWKADQNIPEGEQAKNLLGLFGAFLAERCFRYGFGIASFLLLPVLLIGGAKLVWKDIPISFPKVSKHALVILIWLSLTLSFFINSPDTYFPWGGAFGDKVVNVLGEVVGTFGTGTLLLFILIIYLVLTFNINLHFNKPNMRGIQKLLSKIKKPEFKYNEETEVQEWEQEISTENKIEKPAPESMEIETVINEPEDDGINLDTKTPTATESSSTEDDMELEVEEGTEEKEVEEVNQENYDSTLDLSNYNYPSLDLLKAYGEERISVNKDELEKNKNQIIETLRNYNIEISKIRATVGPTVTLYEIVPAAGVRISKIRNLEDDIALSLAALGIRIIAPIPGRGTIGIEVPNVKKEIVSMRTMIASEKFQNSKYDLPIALGKSISNEIWIEDLARMPHLLMAGATGQGKSVGLNAVLVSLLYKKHPSQLKFVLIDPKKVELTLYKHIEKHFLAKLPGDDDVIITDIKKVIYTLNALCIEMDNRYDLLKEAQVRNLKEYNAKFVARRLSPSKGHQFLPFIVLVIDEFADLMMTAGKEIETPIARLAQLARAVGIHLVIATQRPSVNIITGTIKANFPGRIAFKVASKVDSRTILDAGGADQLIGRGDMLVSSGGEITRLQCCFVDTPEVEDITNFIGQQQGYPEAFQLPEYIDDKDENMNGLGAGDRDELFNQAAQIIVETQQGSTSQLQRRLSLGYNRAGRIMDQLEAVGIVGPSRGSKPREVKIHTIMELEQFLNSSGPEDL